MMMLKQLYVSLVLLNKKQLGRTDGSEPNKPTHLCNLMRRIHDGLKPLRDIMGSEGAESERPSRPNRILRGNPLNSEKFWNDYALKQW